MSSVQYDRISQHDRELRRKSKGEIDERHKPPFELPGIQISRIETVDLGDGRGSVASGSGSRRYIIIHSDNPSEISRLSCPSDYSLAGSRSSRSRSSRASSGVSSRLWDFSPRESEWDADISVGSRESQISVLKQDWGGGTTSDYRENCLSPVPPRKYSVVTFDMGSPSVRRHSSPAYTCRRKESGCECGKGNGNGNGNGDSRSRDVSYQSLRFIDEVRAAEVARKRSTDMSYRSLRIDEDERLITECTPLRNGDDSPECKDRLRPPLRRNNTDDSEVERRVARIFKEIEYSVSDSVDESKMHSLSSEYDYYPRKVEAREVETQTMTESELISLLEGAEMGGATKIIHRDNSRINSNSSARQSIESNDNNLIEVTEEDPLKIKTKEKTALRSIEKKLSNISNVLAALGRKSSEKKESKVKNIPRSILMTGLSNSEDRGDPEAAKSPPPTYEDVMNKNL